MSREALPDTWRLGPGAVVQVSLGLTQTQRCKLMKPRKRLAGLSQPGGHAVLTPAAWLPAWESFVVVRGRGGTAATVLMTLLVSNVWVWGVRMLPGSPRRDPGKGRRPWVVMWGAPVGPKEKFPREGRAALAEGLESCGTSTLGGVQKDRARS